MQHSNFLLYIMPLRNFCGCNFLRFTYEKESYFARTSICCIRL